MRKSSSDRHEFSLYWPDIARIAPVAAGEPFYIDDNKLYHRIVRVLRLTPGAVIILFDSIVHMQAKLIALRDKQSIELMLLEKHENKVLKPSIQFILPILKRDAFEQAIYSLVELGATDIQLMNTQKVQRKWGEKKELDRLHTIMIAAAEQSKQYRIPTLHEPQSFIECMRQMGQDSFFFDPLGEEILPIITSLQGEQAKTIHLMIGPEGDLTIEEKELLKKRGTQFLRLTPTILRAQQAVAVSMGIFRSLC